MFVEFKLKKDFGSIAKRIPLNSSLDRPAAGFSFVQPAGQGAERSPRTHCPAATMSSAGVPNSFRKTLIKVGDERGGHDTESVLVVTAEVFG